jgi:hypothetical protein
VAWQFEKLLLIFVSQQRALRLMRLYFLQHCQESMVNLTAQNQK